MLVSVFKKTPFTFVSKHNVAVSELFWMEQTGDKILALLQHKFSRNTSVSVTVTQCRKLWCRTFKTIMPA